MRKVIFFIQTMKWDNIYSSYYAECLYTTDTYEDAERFCLTYKGDEPTIYIQKAYEYEKENAERMDN